jgi:uncharacterized membrane protein YdjX (TVP38/TMEM64 family)
MPDSRLPRPSPPGLNADLPGRRLGPVRVTRGGLIKVGLAVLLMIVVGLLWARLGPTDLHERARALPAVPVLVAIAVLPLAGFPVSWLHVVAGVRFGFAGGIGAVALTSVIHHALGWALVQVAPARWRARAEPWRRQLAGAGHREATLLCCLVPGMPYAVQLYLLPILGTPWPLVLGLSSVLHTARATVTILLGDLSDALTPERLALVAGYYLVLGGVSALVVRRLRRALAARSGGPVASAAGCREAETGGNPP